MNKKKIYIDTYGCQMNIADSEVVAAILLDNNFQIVKDINSADIILINTCSVRDSAEQRVWGRIQSLAYLKKKKGTIIGIIGCIAQRLKQEIFTRFELVDIVAGPDSYRVLPQLIQQACKGQKAINTILSTEELYSDIEPVRIVTTNISAFVTIMRGCNNMCSYCIVPFTRGQERSRNPKTIINDIKKLLDKGYKEITLIGQNVDSYYWKTENEKTSFADLLQQVARSSINLRIRFTTSHPKDISDKVLYIMAKYENICKCIHLPVQSGSSKILKLMNRGYTIEWYLNRIAAIRKIIPDCAITTDILVGFPGETDKDFNDTLTLMKQVKFDFAYMFKYSERPHTLAARKYKDDIPEEIKLQRLNKVISLQKKLSLESNKKDINKIFKVLIEGRSKKSPDKYFGRNSQNKVIVFSKSDDKIGDYVNVRVTDCTSATLLGNRIKND